MALGGLGVVVVACKRQSDGICCDITDSVQVGNNEMRNDWCLYFQVLVLLLYLMYLKLKEQSVFLCTPVADNLVIGTGKRMLTITNGCGIGAPGEEDSGRGLHQKVIKKRFRVRIQGVCCSEKMILTQFSPNFPRRHAVSGVGSSHCTRGPTISLQCTRSKQVKVGEEIRVHKFSSSTRTCGLWSLSGCCVWNRNRRSDRQRRKRAVNKLAE